ncbi:glycosyltransferase [Caecibacteroides pullorum]|uniref:Glycosyltransferase n=1 Tax=Caecibacteroides pullorum TaxID=2725562 RepID=A0AA40ZU21_9BACT|nr:glycosyltransferase [Caecibacteroides pullorum]MBM6857664.1 glycosyltransferase [Caecibacteroides pullorum]MBV8058784.1 glycosyltransferase family 4 protein [Caecibacteroides pullorum]
MKSIIYIIWSERLNVQRGGVHRIIHILMQYLPKYGYMVRYLYTEDTYQTFHLYDADIEKEITIPLSGMRQYLIDNHCDLLIGQDGGFFSKLSELVAEWKIPGMKYITEFHNSILLMEKVFSRHYWHWVSNMPTTPIHVKWLARLRLLMYPLWLKRCRQSVLDNFLVNYRVADILILLSKYEIPEIQKLTGTDLLRCKVINNPLSWEKVADAKILQQKKKQVLIVSRLYNPEKRIDRALKIWKILEQRGFVDWKLIIVGAGVHEEYLQGLSEELALKNVTFTGRQDPIPYYRDAALFMMTSAVEGWGLTLTESMQTGVVPIAFDSYPALHDIITDGYDGCIIPDDDLEAYADCMVELMCNRENRERIAKNGLESCRRFEINRIVEQWVKLIESL